MAFHGLLWSSDGFPCIPHGLLWFPMGIHAPPTVPYGFLLISDGFLWISCGLLLISVDSLLFLHGCPMAFLCIRLPWKPQMNFRSLPLILLLLLLPPNSSRQKSRHESQSLRLLAAARLHVLITGCVNGLTFWSALVPPRALDAPSTPCVPWETSCRLQLHEHPPKAHWGIAAFQRKKTDAKPKDSPKCTPRLGHTNCTECPALPPATVFFGATSRRTQRALWQDLICFGQALNIS